MAEWCRRLSGTVNSDGGAAMLLAIAALATAWSSYQASIWGGIQAAQYSRSSALRAAAGQANDDAARSRLVDISLFTKWLEAYAERRPQLAAFYERHFRPEFVPAFEAWRGLDSTSERVTTPFDRGEYHLRRTADANVYNAQSVGALAAAEHANKTSDEYVFDTVILASVLFFAGAVRPHIAPRWQGMMLLVASLLCGWAIVRLFLTPVRY
jgi:hypothetical protein